MAGDWLKWTVGLAGKREVRIMASRLHRDRHEIAGRLMVLWEWLGDNLGPEAFDPDTGDAHLEMGEDWTAQIDDIVGLPGFAEVLASPAVCWITARSGGRITFPNLGRHNGKNAKMRAMEAQKKARQRQEKCPANVPMLSGLEKRREESTEKSPPTAGAKVRKTSLPPDHAPRGRPKDLDTAIAFAATKPGYDEGIVREWFANRDRQSWETGGQNPRPITNWQSDLDAWVLREARERKNHEHHHHRTPGRASGIGATHDPAGKIKDRYHGL